MIAEIRAGVYEFWQGFRLELKSPLIIAEGVCYQLLGPNGCGKTSFLKKLLIPAILVHSEKQYVIYIEQQIQSQFDAIKADALLNKSTQSLTNFEEMINYQFKCLQEAYALQPKPVLVISDECPHNYLIRQWKMKLSALNMSIVFITHNNIDADVSMPVSQIIFEPMSGNSTSIRLL